MPARDGRRRSPPVVQYPAEMTSWSPSDLVPGLYLAVLGWLLARSLRRWFDPVPGRVWAAFAVVLLVLLGPVLVGGKVLLPLEILTRQAPFQGLRENLPHLANRLQLDLITQIAPALALVRREIRGGMWPLWNHLAGAGMPLMADPQSQAFQPLVVATDLLPLPLACGALAGLRVLVALAFLYLFLRRQGMGETPALCGSLAYGLGGFILLWLGWPIANSAALLPPLLYAVAISDDRGRRRDFLLLALCVWAVLLSGQPETGINDLLLAAAFGAVRLWKRPRGARGRLALRWALAALLAAGAAAPPLWATAEYIPQSHRYNRISLRNRKVLSEDWLLGWRTADQLRFRWSKMRQRLVPIAAPNAYGNNRFGPYWGNENINEDAAGFVGGAALLAALLAAAPRRRGRLREERFFLAVLGVALVVTARPPGLVQVISALPLLGKSATFQHRVLLPFDLAAAYLAAATLERWRHGGLRRWPAAALATALAALVAWAYLADGRPAPPLPPDALADMHRISLAVNLGALAAAALLLSAWRRPRAARADDGSGEAPPGGATPADGAATPADARPGAWRLWALAVLVAGELLAIHVPANPGMPRRIYFPTVPSVAFLERQLGGRPGMRLAALGALFPPNGAAVYDLADARYTNPMKPWNAAVAMLPLLPAMDEVYDKFLRLDHPLYDLLGARYMMASPKQALPRPWRLALADPSAWIYERPGALPRLFLPPEAEVEPSVRWPRWLAARGEYTRRALLAKPPAGARWRGVWRESAGEGASTLALAALAPDHLRAEAALAEPRPLASSLYQDGGWRLLVDGRHLPSTLADGPFFGAWLPAGRSRVDLVYRPRSFLPACLLAALALAGAGLWWWPRPRRAATFCPGPREFRRGLPSSRGGDADSLGGLLPAARRGGPLLDEEAEAAVVLDDVLEEAMAGARAPLRHVLEHRRVVPQELQDVARRQALHLARRQEDRQGTEGPQDVETAGLGHAAPFGAAGWWAGGAG
jgi:hypothetical protein